jgi:predicted Zn finger-like uncharacterized protein
MYTRCPQCRTTFAVSDEQLQARGGVVRCGECHHVFRADRFLMDSLPVAGKPARVSAKPAVTSSVSTKTGPRQATEADSEKFTEKLKHPLPTLDELLWGKKRSRIRPVFWAAGNLFVLMLLGTQLVYFYSTQLAAVPELRPYIKSACVRLGCIIRPQVDAGLIELTNTRISPHPKYLRVLRLRATLINRASFSQPYPLMEVTLSNRRGALVGRRTFRPEEYLRKKVDTDDFMVPNVIIRAEIEFTNPARQPEGFEIRLLPDPKQLATS